MINRDLRDRVCIKLNLCHYPGRYILRAIPITNCYVGRLTILQLHGWAVGNYGTRRIEKWQYRGGAAAHTLTY